MSVKESSKMELLAPAGTLESFETAVAAGADAVYIGAPVLNARSLARDFTWPEIAAMIDYGKRHGVKTYIAMNSLMKEDETGLAVETLTRLSDLKPAALIIQDLGIYRLATEYFPKLRIHASTMMSAHNSLAVGQFARMGFSRVVLARELSLKEIGLIRKKDNVELEVFVHGALCFSYSGLCLFSSFQGGKSGLRGACVQPCRRRYGWSGIGKKSRPGSKGGAGGGYLFSMSDLCAIDLLPELDRVGVTSLKIEGRLRSPQYIGNVVKAYRKILDAGDNPAAALEEAMELLARSMGRRTTAGYFVTPPPADLIKPQHSGNIGIFLGKITGIEKNGMARITLKDKVSAGDRLRLHQEETGERLSFTLKKINLAEKKVSEAAGGKRVGLEIPGHKARPGDSLYLVDTREGRATAGRLQGIVPNRFKKSAAAFDRGRAAKVLARATEPAQSRGGKAPTRRRKGASPLFWLKTDNLAMLQQRLPFRPERFIIRLVPDILDQLPRQKKKIRANIKKIVWALPPIIIEAEIDFYSQAIDRLIADGFREWQIGHISQTRFFEGRKVSLIGDYTLNILNQQAVRTLKKHGIQQVQLAIESDKGNIKRCVKNPDKSISLGLTVYANPPLFTARLKAGHFRYNRTLISPKGEKFILRQDRDLTLALPEKPFSLLSFLPELSTMGLGYLVIDLSLVKTRKEDIEDIARQLAGKRQKRRAGTFNYQGKLG